MLRRAAEQSNSFVREQKRARLKNNVCIRRGSGPSCSLALRVSLSSVRLWGLDPLNGLSWTILIVCVEGGGELTKPNIEFLQKG